MSEWDYECFMKKSLFKCLMSSESKYRGAVAKIKVDRNVHYKSIALLKLHRKNIGY